MNTTLRNILAGGVIIAVILSIIAVSKGGDNKPSVIERIVGAASPVFPTNYISVGGQEVYSYNVPMTSATSTGTGGKGGSIPCLLQTPNATTTGSVWFNVKTATTTGIVWLVSTSTPALGYATTTTTVAANVTTIGTSTISASSLGSFTWVPTKSDQNIFGPNQYVLFSAISSKADPSTGSIGTIGGNCGGTFTRIGY